LRDEVLALDGFDRLRPMPEAWVRECHCILRPDGSCGYAFPALASPWHVIHPTHVRGFHPLNFELRKRARDAGGF
jgi:hypothetical protein